MLLANAPAVLVQPLSKFLLALDQSTATTGYAIFKDQELLTYGHLSPDGEYLNRIVELRDWVDKVTESLNNDLEVAIEDIQLQEYEPNGGKKFSKDFGVTTYKKLAHVQGAILSLIVKKNIPYYIVPSAAWKKTCQIKGRIRNEQKKNAQEFVIKNYNIKPTQDEADAICIGYHILQNCVGFDWS